MALRGRRTVCRSVTAPGAVSPVADRIGRPAERLRHAEHVMGTVFSFDIPAPAAAVLPEVVSVGPHRGTRSRERCPCPQDPGENSAAPASIGAKPVGPEGARGPGSRAGQVIALAKTFFRIWAAAVSNGRVPLKEIELTLKTQPPPGLSA